ncbi:MAG: delta-aminolevulinic acid dehydratase, partial [Candidatus Aerophobus sp.]
MRHVEAEQFKGYDPYDALNSKILRVLSFSNRWLRIAFTQGLKKFPLNLRPLLLIEKGYNPKGLGLFLTGYLKLYSLYRTKEYLQKINYIISLLEEFKCNGYSGHCWGYNFDWQSEIRLTPKGTPTIVNTSFIAHAFLDAYELFSEERFLGIARSACEFILHDLHITRSGDSVCFSYSPIGRSRIHNANILGAGLLARVYSITREEKLLEYAQKAVK